LPVSLKVEYLVW